MPPTVRYDGYVHKKKLQKKKEKKQTCEPEGQTNIIYMTKY